MWRKKKRIFLKAAICILLAAAVVIYLLTGMKYKTVYLPYTTVNGIDVSGMTVEEGKAELGADVSTYKLTLEERSGKKEQIRGSDMGLHLDLGKSMEEILAEQNPLLWGIRCFKGMDHRQDYAVKFDRAKLESVIRSLACLNPEQITEPSDAYITYTQDGGLQIVPEERGSALKEKPLFEAVEKAVRNRETVLSLEKADVYKEPEIRKDDAQLTAQLEKMRAYTDMTVTYRFGSHTEVLDGNTIYPWLSEDSTGNISISRENAEAYVQGLAEKYNTAYCTKQLETSYGQTVTITAGSYGWMIDKQSETDALLEILQSGESREREPIYLQTAASHDGPDYGDTYVELNLTAQHLFFYKDGELLVESDFVSGDEAKGWSTPAGAYGLTYKQRDATLNGKTYSTPVAYWMPFNGNIGMHDGYWRSSFGGTIYKSNGSHGCVNLPPSVAACIFENIEAGDPVLCYHLEGTET